MAKKECVEREAAIAEVSMMAEDRRIPVDSYGGEVVGEVIRLLRGIPAADVRPVVLGKWEHFGSDVFRCSECGYGILPWNVGVNFCPNCGADMREGS